ncbi:MAG: 50S ribosomal protein L6 [bacterium]
MSRIAKFPIAVPSGVEVEVTDRSLRAKGPKGELNLALAPGIRIAESDGVLTVSVVGSSGVGSSGSSDRGDKNSAAMSGTMRAMAYNLIHGVSQGFEKRLSIVGVGYRAQAQGAKLNLSLGFSHPVVYQLPSGVSVETPSQTEIVVRGADKQQVGQVAAEIRAFRPPEPYKGKGIRYHDEQVRRKQAKKK